MPPIRVGSDALHFEINISSEQMEETKGVPVINSGIPKPISVSRPVSGVHAFDLGENMIGQCRIRFQVPRGVRVRIHHAVISTKLQS